MSRQLSNELLLQLFAQESDDPFLMLVTLSHPSFDTVYLVNNSEDIVSRGNTYVAFPMEISMPVDDNETVRQMSIKFDNASLELIDEIRQVDSPIDVKVEAILASRPDVVEIDVGELKMRNATYVATSITASLSYDDFLNTGLTSEKYEPANFRGLFS